MDDDGLANNRRGFLKCMAWAGTGALFAIEGGLAGSISLDGALAAAPRRAAVKPFTFVQLSEDRKSGV